MGAETSFSKAKYTSGPISGDISSIFITCLMFAKNSMNVIEANSLHLKSKYIYTYIYIYILEQIYFQELKNYTNTKMNIFILLIAVEIILLFYIFFFPCVFCCFLA